MKKKLLFIKSVFWLGVIVDGSAGIRLLFPVYSQDPGYRYAMGISAALMWGWTILLYWGSRNPIERKDVLLLTAFPVVSGIILAELMGYVSGFVDWYQMITVSISLSIVVVLLIVAYLIARKLDKVDIANQ